MFEKVFSKGRIGNLEIKNRFVMPAMKTDMSGADRKVTQQLIDYYTARAEGGFGLLISEYTLVSADGAAIPHQLSVYSDDFIPGLAALAEAVHSAGAKMFLQLHHAGRETTSGNTGERVVAPSPIPSPLFGGMPRALTVEEIHVLTEKFADGAERAKRAGFDGVELQMGHGYLLGQFLSPVCNKRTDEYGASLSGRMKFPLETLRAVRARVGGDFPISVRFSACEHVEGGITVEESAVFAKELEKNGADALNVSTGSMASLEYLAAPCNIPSGFNLPDTRIIRAAVKIPIICVGRITEPEMAERIIEDGTADFVAMGRASIADPELPKKAAEGRTEEISPCVGCLTRCWGFPSSYGQSGISCMMNPRTGQEGATKLTEAEKKQKVVIVGTGPAGLETAWLAAARGHEVTVFEKEEQIGGQFLPASVAPGKDCLLRAVRFYDAMCRKYGVTVRLNEEATAEKVKELQPDVIVLATGAVNKTFNIPVKDIPYVSAVDVLSGKVVLGQNVLVLGAGMVGLEVAEYAVLQGRKCTVTARRDNVGKRISGARLHFTLKFLKEHGVEILLNTVATGASKDGVCCMTPEGKTVLTGIDMVVCATGMEANCGLKTELDGVAERFYVIGDAATADSAPAAIEAGCHVAFEI